MPPASPARNPPFSLLIKPASADCNLRCAYCFYLDRAGLYPETARHRMTDRVLERIIGTYLATDQPQYAFGWQGGEPTLMGAEFFRKVVELQKRLGRGGATISNGLQTNGLRIDGALARLMAEYRFLVGVSLDGPAEVHDVYRRCGRDRPTHRKVLAGIETLRANGVEFNILTAVHAANSRRGREVYRYLVDSGFLYHQYIPIVEFDPSGAALPFTIGGGEWGRFLCQVYDEWSRADVGRVSVRGFDALLAYLVDGATQICTMGRRCAWYFLVEHNGDVYPCDFFVEPGERLGNILEQDWPELLSSPRYQSFADRKSRLHPRCLACPYRELCAGDCVKNRWPAAGGPAEGEAPARLSWLCDGWRAFYDHVLPGFRRLARRVQRQQAEVLRGRLQAARLQYAHGPPAARPGRQDGRDG
jgi:uncharacterized protein